MGLASVPGAAQIIEPQEPDSASASPDAQVMADEKYSPHAGVHRRAYRGTVRRACEKGAVGSQKRIGSERSGLSAQREEKSAQGQSVICCLALAGRQVQMEVPLDQARLIRQIISGFAVRLKTLEIAVQKAVSTETFEEAQKAAANYFETRDIFAELPRVEYVDMLEPLQAIYKILETTSS